MLFLKDKIEKKYIIYIYIYISDFLYNQLVLLK